MKVAMGFLDNLLRAVAGRPEARELDESERLRLEVVRLYQEGRFAEAELAARRLVELQRELAGEEHPDYATALSNLALLLQQQGDLDAAEPLLRQALEVRRLAHGEDHADYAASLNNLALLLCERRDLDAAEPLLKQALEIRLLALGEDHPDYANGLGSLALLHCERHDLDAAEPLLKQALEIRRLSLGEDHPDYATSLSNLALLLCERRDFGAAEPLLRQALQIRRQTLGEQHRDTISSADSLSKLLMRTEPASGPPAAGAPLRDLGRPASGRAEFARMSFHGGDGPDALARQPAAGAHRRGATGASDAKTLADELATLSRAFLDASELMLQEAARMQEPGLPPDLVALSAASACHRDFLALRGDALRLAESLRVRSHAPERVVGLPELTALIEAIAQAEASRSRQEEIRRGALGVLEQVLALGCRDAEDQPHLEECQAQARVLHMAVSTCLASELPHDADRLGRGDHPLACLLALVEARDDMSGDSWADSYKETASAFGRSLTVAAARGRISRIEHREEDPPDDSPALSETPVEAETV